MPSTLRQNNRFPSRSTIQTTSENQNQTSATVVHPQFARFLSENAYLLQKTFRHLDLTVDFLECQIQNHFATLYSIPSPQFLCQVLSLLLRRPVAAITTGDVLREIICRPVNATLLHSLKFKGVVQDTVDEANVSTATPGSVSTTTP